MNKYNLDNKKKRRGIKGTDVYLAIMLLGWVWYVYFSAQVFHEDSAWMPIEITIGTILLFLYEMFALLRVKMVKEGETDTGGILKKTSEKVKNWVGNKLGVEMPDDVDTDIEIITEQRNNNE